MDKKRDIECAVGKPINKDKLTTGQGLHFARVCPDNCACATHHCLTAKGANQPRVKRTGLRRYNSPI